ncbi:hypothetical protein TREMEDRAFT_64682 [Tremella mesenterica DSM 1558]|uniref:uncharacterized protein n=1 Tax=Tremella mesenterica (strain ATCC 24925 / CBS 8224 / DSM 1558 / NBRC 9311 / NRRL Y-6157 / RJB 2259-6 / UBC 559-6) TaxID=578456 RepID=UPI0003F4A4C6|nr:uncharacterized protein TREMEDRAFT_64682 [Tremella mesenterica DSM 1558]EIW67426.1 hypothetical protein TREMEDRAFT_64682 [Tremella mesenterica DSM 1558]
MSTPTRPQYRQYPSYTPNHISSSPNPRSFNDPSYDNSSYHEPRPYGSPLQVGNHSYLSPNWDNPRDHNQSQFYHPSPDAGSPFLVPRQTSHAGENHPSHFPQSRTIHKNVLRKPRPTDKFTYKPESSESLAPLGPSYGSLIRPTIVGHHQIRDSHLSFESIPGSSHSLYGQQPIPSPPHSRFDSNPNTFALLPNPETPRNAVSASTTINPIPHIRPPSPDGREREAEKSFNAMMVMGGFSLPQISDWASRGPREEGGVMVERMERGREVDRVMNEDGWGEHIGRAYTYEEWEERKEREDRLWRELYQLKMGFRGGGFEEGEDEVQGEEQWGGEEEERGKGREEMRRKSLTLGHSA